MIYLRDAVIKEESSRDGLLRGGVRVVDHKSHLGTTLSFAMDPSLQDLYDAIGRLLRAREK